VNTITSTPKLDEEFKTKLVWKGESSNYTKSQKAFNNALKKHKEALEQVSQVESYLKLASDAYTLQIIPQLTNQQQLENDRLLVIVDIFLTNKAKIGTMQLDQLRIIILKECYQNLNRNNHSFYLDIIKKVENSEEKKIREKQKKNAELKIKKSFGLDVDIDELYKSVFESDEEKEVHQQKFKEFFEKYKNQNTNDENYWHDTNYNYERKKTKAQIEKEQRIAEVEKLLSADINKLFKNLAKLIHPDKELDPELRAKKALLMTNLSNARDNMNIAEILEIKMQVDELIPNKDTDVAFNDTSLTRFAKIIKDKIKQLQNNSKKKLYTHPIFEDFNAQKLNFDNVTLHIKKVVDAEVKTTKFMNDELTMLNNNPLFVKRIISDYKEYTRATALFNNF